MGSNEVNEWFDLFLKIADQPLNVILMFIILVLSYGLYRMSREYLLVSKKQIRTGLLLAMVISSDKDIKIEEAEDRAERMISRGSDE